MHALSKIIFSNSEDRGHSGDKSEFACFAALDATSNDDLIDHLYDEESPVEFECLYAGDLEPEIAYAAPYLAHLEKDAPFTEWIFSGTGKHWGVIMLVPRQLELSELRRHLRKANMINGPDGNNLLFRYYDPRVLHHFLSVFAPKQLRQFFGPIEYFIVEAPELDNVCMYSLDKSGALQTREIAL